METLLYNLIQTDMIIIIIFTVIAHLVFFQLKVQSKGDA